eukprot:TRINITY_DN4309_c0_g1_i1.p1 TRINITY_DN4309_c0_g1~~TRINITY_DN4309_c0_g1_i1.p1  ORF type:complete len:118 (-),score=16.94 TRINITY_DN4309_c0_g1_i1:26-379(-)
MNVWWVVLIVIGSILVIALLSVCCYCAVTRSKLWDLDTPSMHRGREMDAIMQAGAARNVGPPGGSLKVVPVQATEDTEEVAKIARAWVALAEKESKTNPLTWSGSVTASLTSLPPPV